MAFLLFTFANNIVLYLKLSKENNWSGSFTKLPASKDGKAITYTVVEKNVPNKYDSSVTGDAKNGFVITNKHTKEKTSVSGTKTWNDNDNQDGKRPDSITVNLVKDGKVIDSKKVSAADDWKYSFTGLDKYENGKEIKYTVEEEAVPGYTTEVKGTDLINTHEIEKTEISGTKTWNDNDNQDGKRPDSITVKLMKDGKVIDAKNVTAEDDWKYSFTGLDKYENGQEIVYTISEVPVEGYNSETDGFDLINTHKTETVNVNGHKIWKDNNNKNDTRPESITINLLKNGEVYETETVTAKDGWKWSFTDLPKYEAGKEIKYKISENKVEDYRTTVKGYNVENTYNGGGGGNNHNHRKDRRGEDKKHGKQPKTGDELGLYTFMAITGGAIALLIGALYLRKRN